MSRKHFVRLADAIREHNARPGSVKFTEAQIWALAEFCWNQNPRFNTQRWLAYIKGECGPNGREKR